MITATNIAANKDDDDDDHNIQQERKRFCNSVHMSTYTDSIEAQVSQGGGCVIFVN